MSTDDVTDFGTVQPAIKLAKDNAASVKWIDLIFSSFAWHIKIGPSVNAEAW